MESDSSSDELAQKHYDVITQAEINTESRFPHATQSYAKEYDLAAEKLVNMSSKKLVTVRKLFSFAKPTIDVDYVELTQEFFFISDNKVVKIRKAGINDDQRDVEVHELKDFKLLNDM